MNELNSFNAQENEERAQIAYEKKLKAYAKKYRRYSELSKRAQKVAQRNYQAGHNEVYGPCDQFDPHELHQFCLDINLDVWYCRNGEDAPAGGEF